MIIYWLMFLLAAGSAVVVGTRSASIAYGMQSTRLNGAWVIVWLVLTLLIGYRFEVGGDWFNYLRHVQAAYFSNVYSALTQGDPAYRLLNLLAVRLGWGIAGVNVVCACLFSAGLVFFCRGLPRPWLALAVAMPYLVTVVAMGYTRQGVALGLAMLGLVALTRSANPWFVFWVIFAAAFHKSAIILLPIAALAATRNKYWTALWVGVVTVLAYGAFLQDSVDTLYVNYIEAQYQSQGAFIRGAMNLVPACIYLVFSRRFRMRPEEANLWRWFSIISIALFISALASVATTAVDRVALYMLPLQLVVFAYLPDVLGNPRGRNTEFTGLVLFYYGAVLFVWLNFANNAYAWRPYRFYPLEAWF
jgi:hypothetical protein